MEVLSIKQFTQAMGFTQIAQEVRENTNKYPFLTFINSNNEAENVYFSKAGAKLVKAGQKITKELLKQFQIAKVKNADDEDRIKLISNAERLDLSDLLD